MDNAVWGMLNETEKALLRPAEAAELEKLDEDDLLDLHDKIRRARTTYSKLYRRRASAQVGDDASRARAHGVHARTAVKAEAFEEVLARVARRVAKVAKASADALKAERIAAARGDVVAAPKPTAKRVPKTTKAPAGKAKAKASSRTPASERKNASTRAAGRRTEAAKGRR